jgi:hypothetical protein
MNLIKGSNVSTIANTALLDNVGRLGTPVFSPLPAGTGQERKAFPLFFWCSFSSPSTPIQGEDKKGRHFRCSSGVPSLPRPLRYKERTRKEGISVVLLVFLLFPVHSDTRRGQEGKAFPLFFWCSFSTPSTPMPREDKKGRHFRCSSGVPSLPERGERRKGPVYVNFGIASMHLQIPENACRR